MQLRAMFSLMREPPAQPKLMRTSRRAPSALRPQPLGPWIRRLASGAAAPAPPMCCAAGRGPTQLLLLTSLALVTSPLKTEALELVQASQPEPARLERTAAASTGSRGMRAYENGQVASGAFDEVFTVAELDEARAQGPADCVPREGDEARRAIGNAVKAALCGVGTYACFLLAVQGLPSWPQLPWKERKGGTAAGEKETRQEPSRGMTAGLLLVCLVLWQKFFDALNELLTMMFEHLNRWAL